MIKTNSFLSCSCSNCPQRHFIDNVFWADKLVLINKLEQFASKNFINALPFDFDHHLVSPYWFGFFVMRTFLFFSNIAKLSPYREDLKKLYFVLNFELIKKRLPTHYNFKVFNNDERREFNEHRKILNPYLLAHPAFSNWMLNIYSVRLWLLHSQQNIICHAHYSQTNLF